MTAEELIDVLGYQDSRRTVKISNGGAEFHDIVDVREKDKDLVVILTAATSSTDIRWLTLLEAWCKNRSAKPVSSSENFETLRTIDIFDQLSDMERIEMPFINQFMIDKGFDMASMADGSIRWKVYSYCIHV